VIAAVKWFAFLLHIWEILGSNLGSETRYPEDLCGFAQSLQTYVKLVPQIRLQKLHHKNIESYMLCNHS
jgi:hypothetical protein